MAYTRCVLPIVVLFALSVSAKPRVDPLVETELGLIRGLVSDDGKYSMFMGIPYAHVDGDNPFGPATPSQAFRDTFDAFDDSAMCPQINEFNYTVDGTLDCLHLNIYVPQTASSRNRLPVLLWIHGGGFTNGFSGRYVHGPSYFVNQEIILVAINYRLGPYGFMCLDDPKVPGNQGLKDQQLAFKWVKKHIEAFGGDSDKITIYGESAGAGSLDLHLTYNSERLFDKVILQSGSVFGPWAVAEPDINSPLKLSKQLGFETNDIQEAISYISSVNPHLIIAASIALGMGFRPCIEKEFDNGNRFIDVHPMEKPLKNLKNLPILIGFNSQENIFQLPVYLAVKDKAKNFIDNIIIDALSIMKFPSNEKRNEAVTLFRHFYVGDEEVSEESLWSIIDFLSDFYFNHPAKRSIQKYIDSGANNVYHYVFAYNGKRNFLKSRLNITYGGASHADEIGYQFDVSYLDHPNAEDQVTIDRMAMLWANFVKYGNPTPETNDLIPIIWPTVTSNTFEYMEINSDLSIHRRPFHKRMAFWDLFYKLYYDSIKMSVDDE